MTPPLVYNNHYTFDVMCRTAVNSTVNIENDHNNNMK